jgi:hypothetical protein
MRRASILASVWISLLYMFSRGDLGAAAGISLQSASESHITYLPLSDAQTGMIPT